MLLSPFVRNYEVSSGKVAYAFDVAADMIYNHSLSSVCPTSLKSSKSANFSISVGGEGAP